MPIVYTKLFELLKAKGYTTYKIRQEKLIGQGTLTAIKNGTGGLDAKTIARLCEVLECQPGDLMRRMFRKRCDCFREQNHPLIEQKLPTSGSSKSGEKMNCFIGQATGGKPTLPLFIHSLRYPNRLLFLPMKHRRRW